MSPPEVWGPPTWTFLHTLVEKIKENAPNQIYEKLFLLIKMICKNLPCPYCATDAIKYLNSINLANIKTKKQLENALKKEQEALPNNTSSHLESFLLSNILQKNNKLDIVLLSTAEQKRRYYLELIISNGTFRIIVSFI